MSKSIKITPVTLDTTPRATRTPEADTFEIESNTPVGELIKDLDDVVVISKDSEGDLHVDLRRGVNKLLRFQEQNSEGFERAVEGLMPPAVPSAAETEQARCNAELRVDYLANTPCYTSDQIAELAGSNAKNKSQRASRLKKENRVFSITHNGQRYFPAFQFDADINPKPVIARVLQGLDEHGLHGWQIALWFVTNSAFLGGQPPLEFLDKDPDLVVEAATREAPW